MRLSHPPAERPAPTLVVLDMIGTTIRSGPEVEESFRGALAGVGIDASTEAVDRVRGRSKREAVADLVAEHLPGASDAAEVAARAYGTFQTLLRARYEAGARAVPGAAEAIEGLERSGLSVVLTTGLDRATAESILRGVGWASRRDRMLTGDDVRHGRPAPDLVFAAMALVGETDAGRVLVAGDTTADLEAAGRAGVRWTIGVLGGAHARERLERVPHTALLSSVAELPGWIARLR